MTAYDLGRGGRFTVTMADGHVWRQAESDILLAKWNKPAQFYKVTITNGSATDLYNMRVNGAYISLNCATPANGSSCSDLVRSVVIQAGDLVDLLVGNGGASSTAGNFTVSWSVELDP